MMTKAAKSEEPQIPKKEHGHAADDELDLTPALRSSPNSNSTLHSDLENAPIRRLQEPYPMNGCSVNGQLES
jgi:hypothetical protein